MPSVFGRDNGLPHPYDAALFEWLTHPEVEYRAMARNLMHDERVSQQREDSFDRFGKKPRTALSLQNALSRYFEKKIRTRKIPHYMYRSVNIDNLITNRENSLPSPNKDVKLVRLLDLNGLWKVFAERPPVRWNNVFADFPKLPNEVAVAQWLDDQMNTRSPHQIRMLLKTLFNVLNDRRRRFPFQPTWATTWDAFEPYLTQGPDRWVQALGIVKTQPRWIVVLKYPVREAGDLVRPTQLDVDSWGPNHFPSPLQEGRGEPIPSGHPMDLQPSSMTTPLLPEYIHKQIDHFPEHVVTWDKTSGPTPTDLPAQRHAHHQLLAWHYGRTHIRQWMPDPV